MREIPLTRGKIALVDDKDFTELSKVKWTAHKGLHTWYAKRKVAGRHVAMHREILGLTFGDGILIDHKDFDGLNNQRHNLRICNKQQNSAHTLSRRARKRGHYRGVGKFRDKTRTKPWVARIGLQGKFYSLGVFYTEEAAALAYNLAAQRHFGEFARLNSL